MDSIADALARNDYYALAKLTMEKQPMKINVMYVKSEEQLQRYGNKFFTEVQVKRLRSL